MKTDDLIAKLSAEYKPVKPMESFPRRFMKWLLVSIFCVASSLGFMGLREDWRIVLESPLYLVQNILILLAVLSSSAVALLLSVPGKEKSKALKLFVAAPLFFWALLLFLGMAQARSFGIDAGYACMSDITVLGVLPGICLFFLIKQGATLLRGYVGFLALLASAGVGAWTLQFACHNNNPSHLFLWHFLPTILLGLLGIKVGQSILKKL